MKVALVVAVLSAVLMSAVRAEEQDVRSVVRARRFELVGEEGTVIGILTGTAEGPAFVLLDSEGKRRAEISVTKDGPSVALLAADESPKVVLNLGNDGHPGLNLRDSSGKTRYDLRLREDERPCMLFWDQSAPKPRMGVGINPNGNPNSVFFDADFNRRAWMQLLKDAGPSFGVGTAKGTVWSSPEAK